MKNEYQPKEENKIKPYPPKSGSDAKKKIEVIKIELYLKDKNERYDITDWGKE